MIWLGENPLTEIPPEIRNLKYVQIMDEEELSIPPRSHREIA
jgi:hypothetical protein